MNQLIFSWRVVCAILLGLALPMTAQAQTLEVSPWLPANGRTTLTGSGFKPTSTVALSFNAPRPSLPDGKAVPASVQANEAGEFSLELSVLEPRLSLTARSGELSASLTRTPPELEFSLDGTTVIATEGAGGRVAQRFYFPGRVNKIEPLGAQQRIIVKDRTGLEQVFTIENGTVRERVVFEPSAALLETLERPASDKPTGDAEAYWRERAAKDPTNPFLQLRYAQTLREPDAARAAFQKAIDVPAPFYVLARVARVLETSKQEELADAALTRARSEFARGGYDPGFQVSKAALEAWGNPLGAAQTQFKAKNERRAEAWLAYLRDTTPRFPGSSAVFSEYASWLDAQNRSGEARQIREFLTDLSEGTTYRFGDSDLTQLEAFAAGAGLIALASYLLLQFVLLLKYWPQQTRDLSPVGGRFGALTRAPLMRLRHSLPAYHTFTEKLVLLLLLIAAIAGLAVWNYAQNAGQFLRQPAFSQGTAGGAAYYQALNNVPEPGAAYLRGLGFQFDNDLDKAVEAYTLAPGVTGALNNLGAISSIRGDAAGSEREYQQAAQLGSKIANHNLNSSTAAPGYRGAFHTAHRTGAPMLEVPAPRELVELRFGTLEQELRRMVLDPWGYLNALPSGLPPAVQSVLAAFLLLVLGLQVLWLLIPRVRTAQNAPRSFLYHLGAILIPGSGAADEVWGLLLLPPAIALIGLFVVQNYRLPFAESIFTSSSPLGIATVPPLLDLNAQFQNLIIALIAVYAINFIAWFIETLTWLRRRQPATVAATPTSNSPANPPTNSSNP
jgi:hypothetical protein